MAWFVGILVIIFALWKLAAYIQEAIMHKEERNLVHNYRLAEGFTSNKKSFSAGCVIMQDEKMIFVWHPFNFHNVSCTGKYSTPGGTSKTGFLAWEVAAMEAFEESGIEVEICEEIADFDNFILFLAKPLKRIDDEHLKTFCKRYEVSKVELKKPQEMPIGKARFKDQHKFIVDWYNGRFSK